MVGFYKFLSFSFAQNDKYKNRIVIFRENEHFFNGILSYYFVLISKISRLADFCLFATVKQGKIINHISKVPERGIYLQNDLFCS